MKTLILIRHAKAENESKTGSDFERSLSFRGEEDAKEMALLLKQKNYLPQITVCSPALRTVETAKFFSDILGVKEALKLDTIYEADLTDLLQTINRFEDENDIVALVGHNPGVSEVLDYLANERISMHPGSWAIVELSADKWTEVSVSSGKLIDYQQPD